MSVQAATPGAMSPDFYTYAWSPVSAVQVDGRFVTLSWADGVTLRTFDGWLRENAIGAGGVDVATREGVFDPATHVDEALVRSAAITGDGALEISYEPDGASAIYHPGWLRHVAVGGHRADSWLPASEPWTVATFTEPPTHEVHDGLDSLDGFIDDLVRFGLSRLRGMPDDTDALLHLASKIGAVRDTNFGPIWDVKADIALAGQADTNSTANTNLRLGPHTDLPTRETPPGFQFLHCLVNTAEGGWSTMTDGAAVVAHLQAEHPAHYEALTTLRWVFFNRGPGIDHRWSGPIIDLGGPDSPLTIRFFAGVRGFPDMDADDMPRAYAAMAEFARLAEDERFQIRYPFEPGDVVGFDNRRVLHGRDSFATSGSRHLRGIYIDHDELRSVARVSARSRASQEQG